LPLAADGEPWLESADDYDERQAPDVADELLHTDRMRHARIKGGDVQITGFPLQ
jgi:hypothetical protein